MNKKEKTLAILVYTYMILLILLLISIFVCNILLSWSGSILVIAFLIVAVGGYLAILIYKYQIYEYICPECRKHFRPSFIKWIFSYRYGNHRKLTCECGKKVYMERVLK